MDEEKKVPRLRRTETDRLTTDVRPGPREPTEGEPNVLVYVEVSLRTWGQTKALE